MAVHITGTMGLPSGAIYPNCEMYFERKVGVVSQSGYAVVPEKTIVKSNASAAVDFYLLYGEYIGTIQTTLGVVKFAFSVLDVVSATFTSCIGDVIVPIPASSVADAQAAAAIAETAASQLSTFVNATQFSGATVTGVTDYDLPANPIDARFVYLEIGGVRQWAHRGDFSIIVKGDSPSGWGFRTLDTTGAAWPAGLLYNGMFQPPSAGVGAGLGSPDVFAARSDLVTFAAGAAVVNGKIYFAAGLAYRGQTGATAIADLSGLVPINPVPGHFGAVASGDETAKLQAMAAYCSVSGIEVTFTAGTWTFTTIDFAQSNVRSNVGAVLIGTAVNAGRIEGITLGGMSTSESYQGAFDAPPLTSGFVVQYRDTAGDGDNAFYVLTKTKVGDFLSTRMRDTVGADGAVRQLIRQQSVFSAVRAWAYKTVIGASYSGAGWADYNYTASVLSLGTGVTSGSENAYVIGRRTNVATNSFTATVQPDVDGIATVSFMGTTTSSNNVTIAWPGGSRVISTVLPSTGVITIKIDAGLFSAFSITVTNNTANYMYLMAVNMDAPGGHRAGVIYDDWAHYLRPTTDSYIVNSGAAEYAMRVGSGSFAGAYHGSESAISAAKWVIDGVQSTLVKNIPIAARGSIKLVQNTLIGAGLDDGTGPIAGINSRVQHEFSDGAMTIDISLTGSMRSDTVYVGMCMPQSVNGADQNFSEIVAPMYLDVSAENEYPLGLTDTVIWENRRTGKRITAHCRFHRGYATVKSGCYVKTAFGSTSYAKGYWSLQGDSSDLFSGVSSRFVQVFA